MSRLAKSCFWCGTQGDLTKEHVWPRWMVPYAHDLQGHHAEAVFKVGRSNEGAWSTTEQSTRSKQGSQLTAKVREVCRRCNNGWMSELEQAAKPLLLRLMSPPPLGALSLDPTQSALIASWALKGAWMRELTSRGTPTATRQMRSYLGSTGMPPPGARVWIAQHQGQLRWDTRSASVDLLHQDRPLDRSESRRLLLCTLTFAGLALLSRTVSGAGIPEQIPNPEYWLALWPVKEAVVWPPPRPATDEEVVAGTRKLPGRFIGPWRFDA